MLFVALMIIFSYFRGVKIIITVVMTKENNKNVEKRMTAAMFRGLEVGESFRVDISNLLRLAPYKSLYGRSLGRKFASVVDTENGFIEVSRVF